LKKKKKQNNSYRYARMCGSKSFKVHGGQDLGSGVMLRVASTGKGPGTWGA